MLAWLSVLCVLSVFSEIPEDEGVWVLTDSNFEEALTLQPNLLVEFYAPWCGHCKKLAPEYSKAAQRLLKNNPPVRIAKVDATENSGLAQRFNIEGYPTLKYFVEKSPTEYGGGRTEDSIVSFILKKVNPSVTVLDCACDLDKRIEENKITAVLLAQKESPEAAVFEAVSKKIDQVVFLLVISTDALEKYSVTDPFLILFKQFDDKRVDFSGKFTESEITDFIKENSIPLVIPFDEAAIQLIFRDSNPVIFLFSDNPDQFKDDFSALSQEFKGKILFCQADLITTDNGRLAEFLGLKGDSQPTALILDPKNSLAKYLLPETVSKKNLQKFITNWLENTLLKFLKSDNVPNEPFENNVRIVVGKNFPEVVYDKTKDVLVEFYAPWCGHCKELAPHYERLATELKEISSVVIAKIDATLNEVDGQEVSGLPTIRFYPGNDKKAIEFGGERTFDGLLNFVKENAFFKLPEKIEKVEL